MVSSSPSVAIKRIEADISLILKRFDLHKLGEKDRKAVSTLRQSLGDAKIYANDYEVSEMRDEQLANAKKAKKHLSQARQAILKASESNIFSAIDVAQLTAHLDQTIGALN